MENLSFAITVVPEGFPQDFSSCGRLSVSQTAFARWTRVESTACLLAVWLIGSLPSTFALQVLYKPLYFPVLSLQPLKIETACFSETSASTCKYTQRQNPRPLQQQHDNNRHDSLISHLRRCYINFFFHFCFRIHH
jgi:hypothetical protein